MTNSSFAPAQNWKEAFAALFSMTGLLLVVVFVTNSFLDQFLTDLIQDELMNPKGTSNWIWFFGGVSFALGLIGPLLISFLALCAWRFPEVSVLEVLRRHFSYLVREEMRAMGSSLLWGLLLVIPGIVRFFQCAFVSYVVLLDPLYQRGERDALHGSWERVRRVWGRLLLWVILFGLLLPFLLTSLDEWRSIFHQPLTAVPLLMLELTLALLFQWQVLKTWERATAREFSPSNGANPAAHSY